MPDAWEGLISGSTIQFGDAWEHLLAQGGTGGGETIILSGEATVDISSGLTVDNIFDLRVDSGYIVTEVECVNSTSITTSNNLSIEVDCT